MGAGNQLVLRVGLDAVEQACESAIEAQRGEMQYDTTRGIPTGSTLWAGVPNQQRYRHFCVAAIEAIEGVTSVKRFNTVILDNTLEYEAEILTEFGPVTIRNLT